MPKLMPRQREVLVNVKQSRKWWAHQHVPGHYRITKFPDSTARAILERLIEGGYIDRNIFRTPLLILTTAGRFYADETLRTTEQKKANPS